MRRSIFFKSILLMVFTVLMLSTTGIAATTATTNNTAKQMVTKITLSKSEITLVKKKTAALYAAVYPSNATNQSVTWYSSNKRVATVSKKGKVKAKAVGRATIYAKAKDGSQVEGVCQVVVIANVNTNTSGAVIGKRSSRVNAFLNALEKYNQRIMKDAKAGNKWRYSNHKNAYSYSETIRTNNHVTNCALIVTWALKEPGVKILSGKQKIWGEAYSTIHYSKGGTQNKIEKYCDVIKENETVESLVKRGVLKRGDIITYGLGAHGHTNVYLGYHGDTGEYEFYDAGRNGIVCVEASNGQFYFDSLRMLSTEYGKMEVAYIIRIK